MSQTNNKIKVLYLSSWPIFDKDNKVLIPFVNEQIGLLSSEVTAVYLSLSFENIGQWLKRFISVTWIEKRDHPWLVEQAVVDSYHIYLPKVSSQLTKNDLWQDYYLAAKFLGKRIFKFLGGFHVIHLHTILPIGGFALGLKKSLSLNYILQEHSGPFNMHTDTESKRVGVKKVSQGAAVVLPVSNYLLETMKEFCHKSTRFEIGLNWVRTDIFKMNHRAREKDKIALVTVASNSKVKGHSLMFDTLRKLIEIGRKVRLDIYGTGYDLEFINEYGIHDLVENKMLCFRGYRSREELSAIMPKYDVYLCTSKVESFGLAPIEAICCGVTVVSTDCGGVREYINDDNGILVEADANNLAMAIINSDSIKGSENNWERINQQYGRIAFLQFYKEKYNEFTSKAF